MDPPPLQRRRKSRADRHCQVPAGYDAGVGEFVGARAGLGYMIQQRNADTDVPGIFSVLLILGIFGAVMTYTVKLVA